MRRLAARPIYVSGCQVIFITYRKKWYAKVCKVCEKNHPRCSSGVITSLFVIELNSKFTRSLLIVGLRKVTRCLHFSAGCTTGCVVLTARSGAWARTLMTSLHWRAQQLARRLCRRCGAFDRNLKKSSYSFVYFLPSVAYNPEGWQKLDQLQNSTKIVYLFTYLIVYYSLWIF